MIHYGRIDNVLDDYELEQNPTVWRIYLWRSIHVWLFIHNCCIDKLIGFHVVSNTHVAVVIMWLKLWTFFLFFFYGYIKKYFEIRKNRKKIQNLAVMKIRGFLSMIKKNYHMFLCIQYFMPLCIHDYMFTVLTTMYLIFSNSTTSS